jgi:hypothetical protein
MSINADEARREMIESGEPLADLAALAPDAPVWDTQALQQDYEVIGFAAPFVVVRRRSDNQKGTLEFTHRPRWYFNFEEDHG